MEVEGDVEEDCVDDYCGEEVAEDYVGAGTGEDDAERHDREGDTGLVEDEKGEGDGECCESLGSLGYLKRVFTVRLTDMTIGCDQL